jgi:monoamine oxidase
VDRGSALRSLSVLALERKGARYFKIRGGNDRLPHAFALRLAGKIRYGSPVVRIERADGGGLRVVCNEVGGSQTLSADRLVIAVPFSVLRNIEIDPPFSDRKGQAIRQLLYASSSKVFLQTRTRFWAKEGLSGSLLRTFRLHAGLGARPQLAWPTRPPRRLYEDVGRARSPV